MPDSLQDLFDQDTEARAFYDSLPMFIRHKIDAEADGIQSKAELSGRANDHMRSALGLEQYKSMFEDETDSPIDLM